MRILHTSDWHLGRCLHALSLHDAQAAFVEQLVQIVVDEQIDVVIIAGDVFDRAVPPVSSVELFGDALARIAEHAEVFVTSGNHDSAIRLGYGAGLFRNGVHVSTAIDEVGSGVTVSRGEVSVRFYPIPYLDPDHARTVLADGEEPLTRSHQAVMQAAMDRVRDDLATQQPPTASVVIAHAFVCGASGSDSERDISVGGVDSVPAAVFAGVSYVALGHLHGQQDVSSEQARIRYCGSPLRYSFSERVHHKSVTIIDIAAGGVLAVSQVEVTQPRDMSELRGPLAELLNRPDKASFAEAWVRAIVTDPDRPADLMARVREVFPHALVVMHEPEQQATGSPAIPHDVRTSNPVDVALDFLREVAAREATEREVIVLQTAYESAQRRMAGDR